MLHREAEAREGLHLNYVQTKEMEPFQWAGTSILMRGSIRQREGIETTDQEEGAFVSFCVIQHGDGTHIFFLCDWFKDTQFIFPKNLA